MNNAHLQVRIISVLIPPFHLQPGAVAYRKQKPGRKIVPKYGTACSYAGTLKNFIGGSLYGNTCPLYGSIFLIPPRIIINN